METAASGFWQIIWQGLIAGAGAGVTVAAVLEVVRRIRQCCGRRRDVKCLRDLLTQGR